MWIKTPNRKYPLLKITFKSNFQKLFVGIRDFIILIPLVIDSQLEFTVLLNWLNYTPAPEGDGCTVLSQKLYTILQATVIPPCFGLIKCLTWLSHSFLQILILSSTRIATLHSKSSIFWHRNPSRFLGSIKYHWTIYCQHRKTN